VALPQFSREHVLMAIEALRRGEPNEFGKSTGFDLVYEGVPFPPKAVAGIAAAFATGQEVSPGDFSSGVAPGQAIDRLRRLGFTVVAKAATPLAPQPFQIGRVYQRRRELHEPFGGQWQGGISTPASWPLIFLFTGASGEQYGYRDGWDKNGVYLYTGEGQIGDMQFTHGNLAIRDHTANGKDLLLFQLLGHGQGCRYLGAFACAGWEYRGAPDRDGHSRQVIVFQLLPLAGTEPTQEPKAPTTPIAEGMEQLRRRAMAASASAPRNNPSQALRTYYERSEAVRQYVLVRAKGECEACHRPAPF
jgi:5-methylcytosine-specific restriction protein A